MFGRHAQLRQLAQTERRLRSLFPSDRIGYDLVAEARAAVKRARAALTAHDRLRALLESQWRDAWAEAWVRPEGASRAQKRGGATRHRRAEDWRKVARKEDADRSAADPGWAAMSKAKRARLLHRMMIEQGIVPPRTTKTVEKILGRT